MTSSRLEPRWPPRSPHEAHLSSPTGRQKIRQYHDRISPSPSPLKRSSATRITANGRRDEIDSNNVEEEEGDDEETLQLQLAAIEARLRLKKLREKKKTNSASSDLDYGLVGSIKSTGKEYSKPLSPDAGNFSVPSLPRPKSSMGVQIPVSPQRKKAVPAEVKSPGRVMLGIDKGLKGRNISLRRPAGDTSKDDDPFQMSLPSGSVPRTLGAPRSASTIGIDHPGRPMSFSEKIAETRQQDKALKARAEKARNQSSAGFGVEQNEIDTFQASSGEGKPKNDESRSRPINHVRIGEFSRDEILKAANKTTGNQVHRSNTSAGIRRSRTTPSTGIWINPNAPPEAPEPPKGRPNEAKKRPRSHSPTAPKAAETVSETRDAGSSDSLFEPFSSLHLSKRLLPHHLLTRTLSGKHLFLLPNLLGAVKSPDFVLPDMPEPDHVVLAIIASKSSPFNHKGAHKSTAAESTSLNEAADSEQNVNGKYMVLTLTDLKWTIELFLFGTGYTRFRKLTPGTVVALLNPDIMPPMPGKADTGRFSLKLSSSDDTVLELGTSRDLGWCKSVRKDGKQCTSWIDRRHTEFCEFHVDVVIERTRRGRMEVQGMSAPFAPGGRKGGRTGYFGDRKRVQKPTKDDGFIKEGPQYDFGSGSRYFIGPSIPGQSTTQLLDAEGATDGYGSKEDRLRKRLAEREKENEIARKLGEGGNGAGSEYLRLKKGLGSAKAKSDLQAADDPVDATSLGLLGNRAGNVHLSPIKKRKRGMVDEGGERKKARFVTEKGIKEAGRESFGGECRGDERDDEDDDDGLEVV